MGVDYEWLKKQFASQAMMEKPGMTVSRWIDGVLDPNETIDQGFQPARHRLIGATRRTRRHAAGNEKAMEKVDLMVIIDPYPTASAAMPDRKDGVYLLPACTQFETSGSATASNRSIQWRERVIASAVRITDRSRDHVRIREEVRLCRAVRQELQDREA